MQVWREVDGKMVLITVPEIKLRLSDAEKKFNREYKKFLQGNPPKHWPKISCTFTRGRMKVDGPIESKEQLSIIYR